MLAALHMHSLILSLGQSYEVGITMIFSSKKKKLS